MTIMVIYTDIHSISVENTPKWGVLHPQNRGVYIPPRGGTPPPGGSGNRVSGSPRFRGLLAKTGQKLGAQKLLICTETPFLGFLGYPPKMAKMAYFDPFLGSKKGGSGFPQAFRGTPP